MRLNDLNSAMLNLEFIGAIVSGLVADFFGLSAAIGLAAFLTFLSGIVVQKRMTETWKPKVN
jgi:hypothetical protein